MAWGGGSAVWRTRQDGFKGGNKGMTCGGKGVTGSSKGRT